MEKKQTKTETEQQEKKAKEIKIDTKALLEKYFPATPEFAEKLLKRILALNKIIIKAKKTQTLTPCLYGFTGVGKTSIVKSIVENTYGKEFPLEVLLLQSMLPEDVLGIPAVVQEGDIYVTKWSYPEWFRGGEKDLALFLDEIDKARPETHSTILTLLASKKVKDKDLTEGSFIVAAMQPVDPQQMLSDETGKALVARMMFIPINTTSSLKRALDVAGITKEEDREKIFVEEKISEILHPSLFNRMGKGKKFRTFPLLEELSPRQLDYAIALYNALDDIIKNKIETDLLGDPLIQEMRKECDELYKKYEIEKAEKERDKNKKEELILSGPESGIDEEKEEAQTIFELLKTEDPEILTKTEMLLPIYFTFFSTGLSINILSVLSGKSIDQAKKMDPIQIAKSIFNDNFQQAIKDFNNNKEIYSYQEYSNLDFEYRNSIENKFVASIAESYKDTEDSIYDNYLKNGGLAHISQMFNDNPDDIDTQKLAAYMYCILLKYAIIEFDYDGLKQTLESQFNTLKDVYMPEYKKETGKDAILFFGKLPVDDMKEIFEEKLVEAGIAWVLKYDKEQGKGNREQFKKLLKEITQGNNEELKSYMKKLNDGLSEEKLIEKNILEFYFSKKK